MALKTITVPVDGADVTFSNEDWDAILKPYGLKKTGWRQNDNLFNLLLGILAAASPALRDTSNTSTVAIGLGAKTLVAVNGRPTPVGTYAYAFDAAAPTANWMFGQVTANAGTAGGNVTITVILTNGAGSPASWVIQPSGPRGAAGAAFFTAAGIKTANYQLQVDEQPVADCRGRDLTFTAPPNVTVQQKCRIRLIGDGTLTIARNATAPQVQLMRSYAEDAVISAGGADKSVLIEMEWIDNAFGWAISTST